jgi:hypothetical protein
MPNHNMPMENNFEPGSTLYTLPLTDEQLREREKWMMEEGNWRDDHSVPSVGEHYRYMWKWDSAKAVVINARRGDPDRSATELATLLKYVDPMTGFMSNKIFATADHKTWRDYPEAWNFNNNKVGSSYTQPPLEAWAAMETYESFVAQDRKDEGLKFLEAIYGKDKEGEYAGLQGNYAYFYNHRQNLNNSLVGTTFSNETGRDSDEAGKPWLVYSGKKGYDAKLEWLQMQKLGRDLGKLGRDPNGKRIDWIPEKVRDKYWVNDVMFNAMYVSNLRYLADIAGILSEHTENAQKQEQYEADIALYRGIADDTERDILEQMWDKDQGFFYNLDKHGNKIPVDSVTGLFPLMLENISEEQASALLDKLDDSAWFDTPFPIPTHAVRSRFYDPNPSGFKDKFTPQWSGTVWIDVNHIIVEEGLVPRAEAFPALRERMLGRAGIIAAKTHELLAMNPKSMEYYSPTTGKGMRVEHFMWSNLGLHFENYEKFKETRDIGDEFESS